MTSQGPSQHHAAPNVLKNRTNLTPQRRRRLRVFLKKKKNKPREDLPPMIPLGGYGRCHPTPITPPLFSPETLQHTKEEREITKMWFAPKSSSSPRSVAWNVSLEDGRRISQEVCASSNGLFIIPVSHVRLIGRRGVPETRATPAKEEEVGVGGRITGGIWTGVRRSD